MLSPVWILLGLLTFYANALIGRELGSCRWCLILLLFIGIAFLMAYSAFTIFFFLDSRITFKSFIRAHAKAAKMLVYNVPICLVVTILLEIIEICYVVLGSKLYDILIVTLGNSMFPVAVAFLVWSSILLLFVPVVVSVLSNMYIKFLHEQPDVYFDQPK
jgi:nitric oxide reductase large subunit